MTKKLNCIMLIDDDEADNFLHTMIIEESNAANHVVVAKNGVEALNMLQKDGQIQPDLIFLDINMPKMNGWEFLDAYKEMNPKTAIPIFMLTTSLNPYDQTKAASQYVNNVRGFYIKPLTEKMLAEVLEKC